MSCVEEKESIKKEKGKFRKQRFTADTENIKLQGLEIKALEDQKIPQLDAGEEYMGIVCQEIPLDFY